MYYYYSHFTERLRRSWSSETEKPGPKSGSLTWCPPDSHGSALKGPRASVTSAEGLFRTLVDYHNKLPREGDLRNWRRSWRNSRCPNVCICCWRMLIPTAYRPECRTASFPPRTSLPSPCFYKPRLWTRITEKWLQFPVQLAKESYISQIAE